MNFEQAEDGKTIVELLKFEKSELDDELEENCHIRTFYWAAFYGRKGIIDKMIMQKRWSPFIQSFNN